MILAFSLLSNPSQIFIDYGNGKNRKGLWLNEMDLSERMKKSLIGSHAFTGNDFVSSFFKKGKQVCFKAMKKLEVYMDAFSSLGNEWSIDSTLTTILEKFLCHLYGFKSDSNINTVREKIFQKKLSSMNQKL